MILDGCFLIELFRKHFIGSCNVVPESSSDNDHIFEMDCILHIYVVTFCYLKIDYLGLFLSSYITLLWTAHPTLVSLNSYSTSSARYQLWPVIASSIPISHIGELLHILDLMRTVIVTPFKEFESISGSGSLTK